MASTPIRGLTPRGGRGRGSRGGRRPRAPKILTPPNSTVSQQNLAMLAQAINHQQEMEAVTHPTPPPTGPTSTSMTPTAPPLAGVTPTAPPIPSAAPTPTTAAPAPTSAPSEPPQVAITPKKVVVVPTPSGEVLRTTSVTSTVTTTSEERPAISKCCQLFIF